MSLGMQADTTMAEDSDEPHQLEDSAGFCNVDLLLPHGTGLTSLWGRISAPFTLADTQALQSKSYRGLRSRDHDTCLRHGVHEAEDFHKDPGGHGQWAQL